MSRLGEIRERLAATTPFDWRAEAFLSIYAKDKQDEGRADAEFIAHSREDIEALLRVAEAAQQVDALAGRILGSVEALWRSEALSVQQAMVALAAALDSLDLADPHPERQ